PKAIRRRSRSARHPSVQGGLARGWAARPVLRSAASPTSWLEAGLLAVPLVQVTVTDFRARYVYSIIAAVGLALGLAFGWHYHAVPWWWSIVGAAGGALAFGALYGNGRLIYRGG